MRAVCAPRACAHMFTLYVHCARVICHVWVCSSVQRRVCILYLTCRVITLGATKSEPQGRRSYVMISSIAAAPMTGVIDRVAAVVSAV